VLAVKDEREDALATCGGLRSLTAARGVLIGERAIPPKIESRRSIMNSSDDKSGPSQPGVLITSSFSLEEYYRERLENLRRRLPEAAEQLKTAGVARVYIQYDGCGDSGQIESCDFFDADQKPVELASDVGITQEGLTDLFYDLLETRHGGWENNDGACGDFEWDLLADHLIHVHNARFTDCDTTEVEGL
jgi:hypothetical protein